MYIYIMNAYTYKEVGDVVKISSVAWFGGNRGESNTNLKKAQNPCATPLPTTLPSA